MRQVLYLIITHFKTNKHMKRQYHKEYLTREELTTFF